MDEQQRQQRVLEAFYDAFDSKDWSGAASHERAVLAVAAEFEGKAAVGKIGAGVYGMLAEVYGHLGQPAKATELDAKSCALLRALGEEEPGLQDPVSPPS